MRKCYSVFLVLCSLFIYSNAQAENIFEELLKAASEAEAERIRQGPVLALTLIPQAKNQSQLGSYLVEQLRIKSKEEKNNGKAKKIRNDIRKIEKALRKLDAGISGWEEKDYSPNLDKLITTFSKHLKRHKNIVEVERNRLAALEKDKQEREAAQKKARLEKIAAKKAEQKKIAAAKAKAEKQKRVAEEKDRLRKLAAFKVRCEGDAVSDDPFASFNATQEPRMNLVIDIGRSKMKLQATKNSNCMWLASFTDPAMVPGLVTEKSFQQNQNNKSQYVLNVVRNVASISGKKFGVTSKGQFVLDFEKSQCLFKFPDGRQLKIACDDGRSVTNNTAEMSCQQIMKMFDRNRTAAMQKLGRVGAARYADCLLETAGM